MSFSTPASTSASSASLSVTARAATVSAGSDDEFSPLVEVVVGTAAGARIPTMDRSTWLNLYPELTAAELARITVGAWPTWLLEEAQEDLDGLASVLSELGVSVRRPTALDHQARIQTPDWSTSGFYSVCPRDLALIVGSTIIQTPSPMRARRHELDGLKGLFAERMQGGSVWIAAPPPRLSDELFPLVEGRPTLSNLEPAFEAANVLRSGSDLFYLVSSSGNEAGLRWLQQTLSALGNYRVWPLRDVYAGTHIDSTIALLREGLVLLNPARIRDVQQLPEPLQGWDHLWCPPMNAAPATTGTPLSSAWIGMNVLSVRPDLAIVDAGQGDLITLLERQGIGVIRHNLRHARALGGGIHCVTLDTIRARSQETAIPGARPGRSAHHSNLTQKT